MSGTSRDDGSEAFAEAWDDFFRAVRRARGRAARDPAVGLTGPQFHLLSPLTTERTLPAGVLAEEAGMSAPGATRMLDGLERAGYVERSAHPDDRRSVLISRTADGLLAVEERRERAEAARRRIHAGLREAEREQATQLLKRLAGIVDEVL